jgi:hypothetical protein
MKQPPRDELGIVPHNHEEIAPEDLLVRNIHPDWIVRENGALRISSAAFTPSSPPGDPRSSVSVDLKKLLLEEGKHAPFNAKPGHGNAELTSRCARELGCQVGWDPVPENNAHSAIWGVGTNKSKRRQLSRNCAALTVIPNI